ncbi:galactosyltransferase-related protein [Chitinophaga sp. RAB17]|uniref:galactosyltransferase-related protein n=1 Tax=Chitinophaga sp. RAB17 TaxID=3233049 RepID=UPI003F8DBD13
MNNHLINLQDVAFLIPVRIDSISRLENLTGVVNYLQSHFSTTIYLCENDQVSRLNDALKTACTYVFQHNNNKLFARTAINNQLIKMSAAPICVLYDADVIIPPAQLLSAIDNIRSAAVHFSLPYDGTFTELDVYSKRLFLRHGDLNLLQGGNSYYNVNTRNSVGGCFVFRKTTYLKCGLENEYIKGWGHDDAERIKRIRKLGYQVHRPDGRLYHLWHERTDNSWFLDDTHELNSYTQYLKVCGMNREQLEKEITGWAWADGLSYHKQQPYAI